MSAAKGSYDDVYIKNFNILKSQQNISEDLSRKSSIDAHCRKVVDAINNSESYFTTSSCSGRFLAFAQNEIYVKKDCEWIMVTHDPIQPNEIEDLINKIEAEKPKNASIHLKFEPFILHVCCRTLFHAKRMLEQCIASGYRNSGISLGSSKIILAVRSTQNLECPISDNGNLLVDHNYIRYICNLSNEKFKDNFERIEKFFQNIDTNCLKLSSDPALEVKTNTRKEEKSKLRLEKKQMFDEIRKSKKEAINKNDDECQDKTINDFEGDDGSFELDIINFDNN